MTDCRTAQETSREERRLMESEGDDDDESERIQAEAWKSK